MKTLNAAWISLATGFVATLYTSAINTTPGGGFVGAAWYGWPVAWMYNLVTFPPATTFNYVNLVIDIVVWAIIAFIVLFIAMYSMKK